MRWHSKLGNFFPSKNIHRGSLLGRVEAARKEIEMRKRLSIILILVGLVPSLVCLYPVRLQASELNIDPSHTAFLILHYQNDIVHPTKDAFGGAYSKRIAEAKNIEHTKAVLDECRKKGILVIHTAFAMRKGAPEIADKPSPLFSAFKKAGVLVEGTWGADFYDTLKPVGTEPVVVHASKNAFWGTDLDIILHARGITDVVMAGIATAHFVILATTLSASDRQYYPVILEDCCNDASDDLHNWILQNVLKDIAVITDSKTFINSLR